MLIIQFKNTAGARRIGLLDGDAVQEIQGYDTTYALANVAIRHRKSLLNLVIASVGTNRHSYSQLAAEGRILPPIDHPDPAHCYVSGTGLTHLGSADTRDAMHARLNSDMENLSDSMKMFRMGVVGGKPSNSRVGVQPEWFYKGDGSIVRASGQALVMPDYSLDGGDEAEIAGLYMIGDDGVPYRLGYTLGNEFSDHVTERQNYLYLAHSKLRQCAIGPALLLGVLPQHIAGHSRIRNQQGEIRWERPFVTGEANMSHSIANLEHHHFKYAQFNRPGDVHIHFFGAAVLSVSDAVVVECGESWEIEAPLFGPCLRNTLAIAPSVKTTVSAL